MNDFGIIVACARHDYRLAKGTCASIRHFLGDVPVCLLTDGDFPVTDLQRAYGVRVLPRSQVRNSELRRRSFGWGLTKMVSFWESPWEHFLFLDADTIVWGDVLKHADFDRYDMMIDRHELTHTEADVNQWFFNVRWMEQRFPHFRWRAHILDYSCTGTFFARRNVFPMEEYLEMLDLSAENPGCFFPGEMGFLNFMIFRAVDAGKIRLAQRDMQFLVRNYPKEEAQRRFPIGHSGPVCSSDTGKVIHWCGWEKPDSFDRNIYSQPMYFFRRKFLQDSKRMAELVAGCQLQLEDMPARMRFYHRQMESARGSVRGAFARPIKKLIGRA